MNVGSILLSEYASRDRDGRLTVVNSFNRITGPGPEWGLPIVYLSLVMHAHREELGEHEIEVRLIDRSRHEVLQERPKAKLTIRESDPMDDGMPAHSVVVIGMMGLKFHTSGPYAFEVYIDGVFGDAVTLYVRQSGPAK